MDKDRCLIRIIEVENPASAIIFCNTKAAVHYVTVVLQRFGYDADELSADRSQSDREAILQRLRENTLRFLVATDVAARGLDIPELSHVVQYEPTRGSRGIRPSGRAHRSCRCHWCCVVARDGVGSLDPRQHREAVFDRV